MASLAGMSVLITGASGGLGSAVSAAFTNSGALVTAPGRAQADLSTAAGARSAVQLTLDAHSRLDAVIHLIGGFASGGPVQQTAEETWDRMFSLNARSAFLLFRAALPVLSSPGGRILAVGSRAALDAPAGLSAYAASKAALHSLVRTTAAECAPLGITVNAVLPSTLDTPANRAAMPDADPSLWVSPASVAALLVFLASPSGRDTSGALIPVYGRS